MSTTPMTATLLRRLHKQNSWEFGSGWPLMVECRCFEDDFSWSSLPGHPELKRLVQAGFLSVCRKKGDPRPFLSIGDVSVPSPKDVLAEMGFPSRAQNELAAYVLINGMIPEEYGRNAMNPDLWHTLLCGIDWSQTTVPNDAVWEEFTGTFADDDRVAVIEMNLACGCGLVTTSFDGHGVKLGTEALGTAELIRLLDDGIDAAL
jgi:hypothetical protein